MTKLLWIFIIAVAIWGGYELFQVWDKYDTEKDLKEQEAKAHHVTGYDLPGMPMELETTYRKAQDNGTVGLRNWLKAYGAKIEDPRKGWIELDYAVGISHDDPAEAKKIYEGVKERTPTNSLIYPRVQELSKTYE